jgi:hypothetical protein
MNGIQNMNGAVAHSEASTRGSFIKKTYFHLILAIFAFIGFEVVWFATGVVEIIAPLMFGSTISWFVVLALFMGVSYLADSWAKNSTSKGMQYAGLGLYVLAESLIFAPLLFIANEIAPQTIYIAAFLTAFLTIALTLIVFITRTDYSFLRSVIAFGGIIALGLIVASAVFGFSLGIWFSAGMVGFAGAAILYDTSNIMLHYREDQYVAASLSLFASVALLFWYLLNLLLSLTSSD